MLRRAIPVLLLCHTAFAAVSTIGSISGQVLDDTNAPVVALVTIDTHGLRQQTFTAPDGTFQFIGLKAGKYMLCAQARAGNPNAPGHAFVDGCLWQDRSSQQLRLAPGQTRTDILVTVKHGFNLKIRVNDPQLQLPAVIGQIGGNALSMHIMGSAGLAQDVPMISQDSKGRDHAIVIPYAIPHQLIVHSTAFALTDGAGKQVDVSHPIPVTVAQGGSFQMIVINVGAHKP